MTVPRDLQEHLSYWAKAHNRVLSGVASLDNAGTEKS